MLASHTFHIFISLCIYHRKKDAVDVDRYDEFTTLAELLIKDEPEKITVSFTLYDAKNGSKA